MKNKLVLWGTNGQDERVLIALELRPDDNKVDIWTFPDEVATEDFSQQLFNEWRNDKEVPFPDQKNHYERELTVTDSLLPEELKVERGDLINRAQTEWHFVVLSSKLAKVYQTELDELQQKIQPLEDFSKDMWEELKGFWGKVQKQAQERNLAKEHADEIRDRTNQLFANMKELREKANQRFRKASKENLDEMYEALAKVEQEIQENFRFQPLFEELKSLQRRFRKIKLTREDRGKVWDRLDAAFKKVKEIRFGEEAGKGKSPVSRVERRLSGLEAAIQKMERSIQRDQRDLQRENDRIARTDGQLEAQIRQAKIMMIEERIRSKEEKLEDMKKTQESLDKKIEAEKKREEKRKEQERIKKAEEEARKKIAQQIEEKKEEMKEMEDKLEKAADALSGEEKAKAETEAKVEEKAKPEAEAKGEEKKEEKAKVEEKKEEEAKAEDKKEEKSDNIFQALGATLGEDFGDIVDTARAVAKVMGEKIEDALEDAAEDVEDTLDKILDKKDEEE